jgi:DNA sulfur modification protein DndD
MISLTKIELENFGPFFNYHSCELEKSEKKKMILFSGSTGAGKTTLLNAISWGLFGSFSEKKVIFDFISDAAKVECKFNDYLECKVILTFEGNFSGINEKIILSRNVKLKRIKEIEETGAVGTPISDFEFADCKGMEYEDFQAHRWEGTTQIEIKGSDETFRNTYFPDIVRDYYIIYGEGIVNPHIKEKIKLAVERNCFATIFEKVKNNLNNLKNENTRQNIADDKRRVKLEFLIEEHKEIKENIDKINGKIEDLNQKIISANENLSKIDMELGRTENTKELRDTRKLFEKEVSNYLKKSKELDKEILGDGLKLLIKSWTLPSQNKIIKDFSNKIKKGDMPENIRNNFLDSLLEGKKCICKRELSSKEIKIIKELRDKNTIGDNYEDFINIKISLEDEINSFKEHYEEYLSKISEVERLNGKRIEKEGNIQKISEKLSTLHKQESLEKQRAMFREHRDDISRELEGKKLDLDDLKRNLTKKQIAIDKYGQDEEIKKDGVGEFIDSLYNSVGNIKDNIINTTRKDIEKSTSDLYVKIVKNAIMGMNEIERVEVSTDYTIKVIMKKGNMDVIKTKFSTGEQLVFAISFLTALRKHSGYDGPIFLDSPFSVLDNEYREEVALNIAAKIPGQLVIFTREDTFSDLRDKMNKFINKVVPIEKEKEWFSHFGGKK